MSDVESNRIKYKREIDEGDKFEKAVVSFLNYNGGGEIFRKKGMTEKGCFVRFGASAQPMTETT